MKEKQKFSTLYVDRVPLEEVSALFNLTVDIALPVRTEIGNMADAALTELETNSRALRNQTNRSQKSKLTIQLTSDRKVCVDLFSEIKKVVVFESSSRDGLRKKAATDLEFFLKPNWDIMKSAIGNQIDQTEKVVLQYRSNPDFVSGGKLIAVDSVITELEAGNKKLRTTFEAREDEDAKQEPSGSDLRPPATDSFIRFCNIIEQAVNYTPNPATEDLFEKMDQLRKRYQALIPPKKDKGTTTSETK